MSGNAPKKAASDSPREVDWLLCNADWLITCDSKMSRYRRGAVAIDNDILAAAGDTEGLRAMFRARREIDLSGHILMPGLINAHTHAAMTLFRGIADDVRLQEWLEKVIFPAEAAFIRSDTVYTGTLLAVLEMLKGGTTTFCDGYFHEKSAARAARESGIRAVLGQGVLDFPTPDQPDPSRAMETAAAFLSSFENSTARVRPSLFCHAAYSCSPETLTAVKKLCRKNGILFQTHLAETSTEAAEIQKRYGTSPAGHMESLGILDELTLCAHGVWLSPEDIGKLARHGSSVAHCPESNMKLASGVAPLTALNAWGIKIGLGTDGCASNNDLDLFSEMRMAALLHKVVQSDPLACPASMALSMATSMGAAVLGLADITGSLEAGKKADLIAIDINQPHLAPIFDPVSHIVYSARKSDVSYVWVDGTLLVENGNALTINENEVLAEANRLGSLIAHAVL